MWERISVNLIWIVTAFFIIQPILNVEMARSANLSPLFLFPLPPRDYLYYVILNGLIDLWPLPLIPVIISTALAFGGGLPERLVMFLLMVYYSVFIIFISQILLILFGKLISSRRWADTIFLFTFVFVFGINFLVFSLVGVRKIEHPVALALLDLLKGIPKFLVYSPPTLFGKAIVGIAGSDIRGGILALLYFSLEFAVLVYLASGLIQRYFIGEEVGVEIGRRRGVGPQFKRVVRSGIGPIKLPSPLTAMFLKERLYLFREPLYKLYVLSSLAMIAYLVLFPIFLQRSTAPIRFTGELVIMIAILLALSEGTLVNNIFGFDGAAYQNVALMPVKRILIILSKNLFFLVYFGLINVGIILLAAIVTHSTPLKLLIGVYLNIVFTVILISIGNIISINFPHKIVKRGGRRYYTVHSGVGCFYWFIYSIAFFGAWLLNLPVLLAVLIPYYTGREWFLPISLILGLLYGGLIYAFTSSYASQLLLEKEIEMVEFLTRPESF